MELNQAHQARKLHIRRFLTLVIISALIFTTVTPVHATPGSSDTLALVQKRQFASTGYSITKKHEASIDQKPQTAPVGVNLKCNSISDGLADLGLCEPDIKPFLSNTFGISGNGYNGKEPNQSIKVVCNGWGCTQVPVYFSLSCFVNWTASTDANISIKANVKNGTAFYITPTAETQVGCGAGREGKCFVNLSGQAPGAYIAPNPDLAAHLFATMDVIGAVPSNIEYVFSCGWSWSLDPITVLVDRSNLSQNSPKNGTGDPRECAVSACDDASASAGDPIDTRTGNFDYSLVDLSLQTIAGPLTLQRSYASLATDTGQYPTDLGPGWTHNQDTRLIFETGKVWFKAHTLNQYQFIDNGNQTYTPYAGVLASLDYDPGTSSYTLTAADQSVYTFDAAGQLQTWRNELGYGFDYSYAAGKLYRVSEPLSGRYLQFNYQDGRLSSVNDQTNRQVSFSYDGSGDLSSFTDARGYNWTYIYDAHQLTTFMDPNSQVILTTAYDAQGRAYEQFNGLGQRIVKITYNGDGTSTLTDALGRQAVDGYDARGVNTFHTDSAGYTVFKEYDANFRLSRIIDPDGNVATYTWSADGANLTVIQDAEGYATGMVYDVGNHLTQVTDPRGQVIDYTYVDGLLDHQTRHTLEWGDITTTYGYTTAVDAPQPVGLVKTITDPLGNTTRLIYDEQGQLRTIQDAASSETIQNETHFAYDAYGRISDVTDPLGRVTHYDYDAAGNRRFVTLNYVPTQLQDEQNQYNLRSEFVYDEPGRLTQVRRKLDETKTLTEAVIYDDAGRIYQTLDALNKATTYGYLETGQIQTITDPLGHTTTYVYDEAQKTGRLMQVKDAIGRVTQSYTYYADSTIATVTIPTVHTPADPTDYVLTYHYDPLKRVVGLTDNAGHSSAATYDAYGNPLDRTDGLGRVTKYAYNELELLQSVTQNYLENVTPDQETNVLTSYSYNKLGLLTALTDANNHTTQYEHNPLGRLRTVTDARQQVTEHGYDQNGNRTSVLDANGNTTLFHYDLVNRLHAIDYPGGVSEDVRLWYDALSRLSGMDDSLGHTAWGYDDAGRITSVSDPFGQAVGYGYDDAGRRTTLTYPGGRSITYQYTPDDQLEHVLEGTQPWADYVYDPYSGRITSQSRANGITTEYAFDYSGQLTDLTHKNAGFNLASYSYHYNAAGSRDHVEEALLYPKFAHLPLIANGGEGMGEGFTAEIIPQQAYPAPEGDGLLAPDEPLEPYPAPEAEGTSLFQGLWDFLVELFGGDPMPVSARSDYQEAYPPPSGGGSLNEEPPATQFIDYGYDALNRLTGAIYSEGEDYAYSYDPVGNRLTQTVGSVTTAYQYDAADRLYNAGGITYTWDDNGNLLADGTNTYAYDAANRLTTVNGAGLSSTFAYDGLGNRYQSTADGQTTTYALDLAGGLSQVLSDGTNTYLYGLERIAAQSASGTGYFLPDGLGSVRQVANAGGMVGDPWAFHPFGNPLGSSRNNPSHYGYAGEWTDGTGLQYLRARYYSPEQGRFITQDPFPGFMTQPSTLNPYAYALNDPATLTDPSGENPFLIAAGLGGLVSAGVNVGVQLFNIQPTSLEQALRCLDWGQVGISFGAGAIAGLTGFTVFGGVTALLGTGLMANVASGAVAGVVSGQYARLTQLVLAGQTEQIRSTLFRSQDIALDAALGGAIAGATYGATNLLGRIRSSLPTRSADVPNPNGRLGGPAHQGEIDRITTSLKNDGTRFRTEFKINTPGGFKPYRFADVASLDSSGNPTAFYQVGRATSRNIPVARERLAITDIYEFGGYDVPIIFIPYW